LDQTEKTLFLFLLRIIYDSTVRDAKNTHLSTKMQHKNIFLLRGGAITKGTFFYDMQKPRGSMSRTLNDFFTSMFNILNI
jgi:hypothetical protein